MNQTNNKASASDVIERSNIGTFQIMVFSLCALIAFIEGFDTQSVGFVAPDLAKAFNLAPDVLGLFFSTGLFGLMAGAIGVAPLADRFGRRPLILFGTFVFGLASLGIVAVDSSTGLFIMRFIMGFGIGAVMPNLIALTAEYSPQRKRAFIVMVMFSGFTLGSLSAGLVAVKLISSYGWNIVFIIGGIMPLLALPFLWKLLPESISWLASSKTRSQEAISLVQRIDTNIESENIAFDIPQGEVKSTTFIDLFRENQTAKTILLWTLFLASLMNIYLLVSWLPKIVVELGFNIETAAMVGVAFQLGGLIGVFPVGWLSDKWSACGTLAIAYLLAAICVPLIGMVGANLPLIAAATFFSGVGILGGQNAANALAADLYPTKLRATAVGSALGVGRIGSIVGPLVAGILLAAGFQASNVLMLCAVPAVVAAVAAMLLAKKLRT